jgi:2-C-methyl-D-erythritol 4-phosphate cytidylyltransferase
MKFTAIVLSAGKGSRMNIGTHKQYLLLNGRPVITYSLEAFEKSPVDEVILVTGQGEEEYCRKEIVEAYGFSKVGKIVAGGKERYHSVFCGLQAVTDTDYVLIHDGARPFVTEEIIARTMETVRKTNACAVGMHVKDTIKITDEKDIVKETPERNNVWMVQTPQAFSCPLISHAYEKMLLQEDAAITDDAMVVEKMCQVPVTLIEGSYRNIKITTPEDMLIAEAFLNAKQ